MRAAVFYGPHQPLKIEEVEIDKPMSREVVVRTVASGVCHSDLHFVDGLYPMAVPSVLGHETAGVIEEVGDQVEYVKPGDHVICCLSVFCGMCEQCLTGHPNVCSQRPGRGPDDPPRLSLSGSGAPLNQFAGLSTYAEKMLVHENTLLKIEDSMPLAQAALISCGVMTGFGAVLNTAKVEPGSTVAVFGAGGVGLSAIQGAYFCGARKIIAVDIGETQLSRARKMGATHIVDASSGDVVQAIKEMTDGKGVDYSFEAIGLKLTAEQCCECLATGGTATIMGMIPVGQKMEIDGSSFFRWERKLQGSHMGSNRFRLDMPRYIELYQQGRLKLDEMITVKGRLEDVNEAFRAMKAGEVARTVLMFD